MCVAAQNIARRVKNNPRKVKENGWADEDVDGFKGEEFDFQANLNMFDKAKVFAEIRESDDTEAETLLVTLNRLPRKQEQPKKVNLLPSEMVLDTAATSLRESQEESSGNESDNESSTPAQFMVKRRAKSGKRAASKIVAKVGQITCPTVSPLQMAHAEHECTKVMKFSEEQLIENGGRGSCMLALQAIGGAQRMQSGRIPTIAVLAGNNVIGAFGLSAARHLINHGCRVVVCVAGSRSALREIVASQQSMVDRIGGILVSSIRELNRYPTDLVIDAMVGSQEKLVDLQEEQPTYRMLCNMIGWANGQNAPVMSIDFPSGIDGNTGESDKSIPFIRPRWTVCMGAPKLGCLSKEVTGELYMTDLGIPRACWKKAGVKGWTAPWGADFLIALEYAS
ncbi:enhancer of mRNA decapping [Apophysomyces ossiformis]|uniref:Enhancer of mRNA-decapping protein 3 n=1 Tax=Apophysomyces ossiformis TaxID=679940 RepID=A0A8H7BP49_9FUNG|nr:enhancer of mRNA decapping [Apophysomyces ossiformis]